MFCTGCYAAAGKRDPRKFDDLPERYRANVNTTEVPYDRHPGDAPALNASETDDELGQLSQRDTAIDATVVVCIPESLHRF